MEVNESPISGSPENTESGSPTPISGGGGGVVSPPPEAATGNGGGGVAGNAVGSKKRRGRPRKYDADGNLNAAYTSRKFSSPENTMVPSSGFTLTAAFPVDYAPKRGGRGRGSGNSGSHQFGTLGGIFAETAGVDFTPHVITVQTGEDVAAKINSVGQNGQKGPRGLCVLSANGSISSVTIRQPGSSGGLLTYEGRFEILSLCGSYTMTESNGVTSRIGGLSISLAGPDGRVVGGSVAGWLTAASPTQVVIGSFVPYGYKAQMAHKKKQQRESPAAAPITTFTDVMPAEISNQQHVPLISEAVSTEVKPVITQSHTEADDSIGNGHNMNVISSHDSLGWNDGSSPSPQERFYPDINVSLPGI